MADWVILVDSPKDFPNADTPHKVITTRDYLARSGLFQGTRPKIVNLARSFAYQSRGYYCSLLAEARGHRIVPSTETMIDLGARQLYAQALPELDDSLAKALAAADDKTVPTRILVYFGTVTDHRFDRFGRLLFDWFRCPVLDVTIETEERPQIRRLASVPVTKLTAGSSGTSTTRLTTTPGASGAPTRPGGAPLFLRRPLRSERGAAAVEPRHHQALGPRRRSSASRSVITRRDRPAGRFDAVHPRDDVDRQPHLPLRPPRHAGGHAGHRRPDLDDPRTNKIYLHELMTAGIAVPPTVILGGMHTSPGRPTSSASRWS